MIRFEDIYENGQAAPCGGRPRAAAQGVHLLRGRAQGPDAGQRRALPRAPAGGGGHPGRAAHGPRLRGRRPPARRARGHPHRRRQDQGALRPRRPPHRGGRHQDQQDPLLVLRGAPGRELPQAPPGHGGRRARHHRQAGRPPPQHAHAAVPARGAPRAHRARDDGHLRAPGRPPGHEQDQERAGGPLLPVPGAGVLPRAHRSGRGAAHALHRVHREDQGHGRGEAEGGGPGGHPGGAHQAPLLHPPEAAQAAHRPRPGLRLRGPAHRGGHHPRLLRRPGRAAQPLAAGARAHQGLHRHAAAQRLPLAAHLGDQRRGPSLRGADPHARDAPHRRGGHRRPLEVQGRAAAARTRTTRPSPGCGSSWSGSRRSRTRTSS